MPRLPEHLPDAVQRLALTSDMPDEGLREHLDWVTDHFKALFGAVGVRSVELILNRRLVERYERRRAELLSLGVQMAEERLVYHGTNPSNHESIVQKGLLVGGRGVTRVHGASYGEGVYVGAEPGIAMSYGGSSFLFCRVLMGRTTTDGNAYMSGAGTTYESYDGQGFCVVYREDQVLPCYIIHA
jgi:hypothetical protein